MSDSVNAAMAALAFGDNGRDDDTMLAALVASRTASTVEARDV